MEEKSERESGRRLMRMGNKKQRGEVRREEEVNEGKSDEKDSDLGKESQQIGMVRTEKERREREVEIWQKEKRKWEEWRREELERREKEGNRKGENGKRNGKKRNWKEKRRKRGNGKRNGVEKKWKKERQEEVERRETEKRE